MRKEELFEVLGELDDNIIETAEKSVQTRSYRTDSHADGKIRLLRRMLAVAAVIALMISSGTIGALAFSQEIIVEVPVAQEQVLLDDIGLTLILPDNWKGRYEMEQSPEGIWIAYSPSVRESYYAWAGNEPFSGGTLFYIARYDEPLTEAQFLENGWDYTAYRYLLATSESTYIMYNVSDVQYDPDDREQFEEYCDLLVGIKDIQIIVNDVLKEKRREPL